MLGFEYRQAWIFRFCQLCLWQRGSSPHLNSLKFNKRAKKSVRILFQVKTKQSKKWTRKMSFLSYRVCVQWCADKVSQKFLATKQYWGSNRPIRLTQFCTKFKSPGLKGLFTWSGGPRSSGVSFFCFVSPREWKQKKPTPLDQGPPLHVNRP